MEEKGIIDLFELMIEDESLPDRGVVAKGDRLHMSLQPLINNALLGFDSKKRFTSYLMKKFNLSESVSERFVFQMKEWIPLFLIKELADLTSTPYLKVQENIEYLKMNHPPSKSFRAVKELNEDLCKIAGAHAADGTLSKDFFRITDGYESNLLAFNKWLNNAFGVCYTIRKVKDSNEWEIKFHSGVISRYLHNILGFPSGMKQYIVSEPKIIKKSNLSLRKNFALGAMTFESGIGISRQVALCVSSLAFRDSIAEILELSGMKFTKMNNRSGKYWRLWSNVLNKEQARHWLDFYEPSTDKWLLLKNYVEGYHKTVSSFDEAKDLLNKVYPAKSASKICLSDILIAIKKLGKVHRYELASFLCEQKNILSYGGKWAHSLSHYLRTLRECNIIFVGKESFGKKKSFGSIIREVYFYNPNLQEWRLPDSLVI